MTPEQLSHVKELLNWKRVEKVNGFSQETKQNHSSIQDGNIGTLPNGKAIAKKKSGKNSIDGPDGIWTHDLCGIWNPYAVWVRHPNQLDYRSNGSTK